MSVTLCCQVSGKKFSIEKLALFHSQERLCETKHTILNVLQHT